MTYSQKLTKKRTLAAYNRFQSLINKASEQAIQNGISWYFRAFEECQRIALSGDVHPKAVAGIAAALSPLTSWGDSLEATRALIRGEKDRLNFYHGLEANQRKAEKILGGEDPEFVLSGPKVKGFYFSILGIEGAICVDSHVWNAVDRFGLESGSPTANARRAIERAIRMIATERRWETFQVQAVIWCAYRETLGHNAYKFGN